MKTFGIIFLTIIGIAIVLAILFILYKYFNERLVSFNNSLDETEVEYSEKQKNKYDLVIQLIKLVESKFKVESKVFEDAKKMKTEDILSIKNEKLLNKCYKEILQIKEDHQKNRELKSFKELIDKYEENELLIISLRTFYNTYAKKANEMIKKIPYNWIAKVKKHSARTLLEGKELETDFNNDLEV